MVTIKVDKNKSKIKGKSKDKKSEKNGGKGKKDVGVVVLRADRLNEDKLERTNGRGRCHW